MKTIEFDNRFFSAKDTLECGQIFRYKPFNDGFLVVSKDKACFLKDTSDSVLITFEDDDEQYFKNFFDLNCSYEEIVKRASLSKYDVVKRAAKAASGVRILRQARDEVIFSFIISQNNRIPRIKSIIERTCDAVGESKSFMGETYRAFPTVQALSKQSVEFFTKLGYGYRAEYALQAAKDIVNGSVDLSDDGLSVVELKNKLLSLKGVGPKVADCITLFGYHRTDSFPVDTWIEKLYREDFHGELTDRKKITDFFLEQFGNDSGYVQQYIFHYKRNLGGSK